MNERTHFFIKIPLTLYSWNSWCWLCVRGELEMGIDCYILTLSSSDYSSTSFAFWLGSSTVGHWGPKALCLELVLTQASCPQLAPIPTGTGIDPAVCGTWLYNCLTSTCFCLFTQVHLLIDGLVEGQYVTIAPHLIKIFQNLWLTLVLILDLISLVWMKSMIGR